MFSLIVCVWFSNQPPPAPHPAVCVHVACVVARGLTRQRCSALFPRRLRVIAELRDPGLRRNFEPAVRIRKECVVRTFRINTETESECYNVSTNAERGNGVRLTLNGRSKAALVLVSSTRTAKTMIHIEPSTSSPSWSSHSRRHHLSL